MRHIYLTIFLLVSVVISTNASVYTTVADGDWADDAIWSRGTAPSHNAVDTVYVNHNVNYGNNQLIIYEYLEITVSGRLYTSKNKAINVHQFSQLVNYGEVNIPNLIVAGTYHTYGETYAESFTNTNNGTIHIHTDGYIESSGQVSNTGVIYNDGTLWSPHIFVNNNGTLSGNGGTYLVDHNLIDNAGAYITCSGENGIDICTSFGDEPGSIVSSSGYIDSSCVTICGRSLAQGAALPITLIRFEANNTAKNTIELSWATAIEINNSYFEVERSKNGVDFEVVAKVEGAGNSTAQIDYQAIDAKPIYGVTYYRLKQTDFDGEFTYSKVVSVTNNFEAAEHLVYPNPSNGSFNVQINNVDADKVTITLYSVLGQIVVQNIYQTEIGISNILQIETNKVASAGTYYLEIQSGSSSFVKTITIE